ncbi:MAG TPA: DUF1440 domain-containing protein [Polyangiaceae bacterium]|nr:DUF1440 domain-containing protein [Polyangiaceae bacterium]
MHRWSPLGAFCGGLVAGLVGSVAQSLYFSWTRKLAPAPALDVFEPVEPEQRHELPTQTIARRFKEHLVHAGPLANADRAAGMVHLAFGSAWGGAYGLVAGTLPPRARLKAGLAFGAAVWLLSDDVLLPAFKLAAWPQHYPVKTHLYALAAHAVYGAAVATAFEGLHRAARPATVALGAYWLTRHVPRLLRPRARRLTAGGLRLALPARQAVLALS